MPQTIHAKAKINFSSEISFSAQACLNFIEKGTISPQNLAKRNYVPKGRKGSRFIKAIYNGNFWNKTLFGTEVPASSVDIEFKPPRRNQTNGQVCKVQITGAIKDVYRQNIAPEEKKLFTLFAKQAKSRGYRLSAKKSSRGSKEFLVKGQTILRFERNVSTKYGRIVRITLLKE